MTPAERLDHVRTEADTQLKRDLNAIAGLRDAGLMDDFGATEAIKAAHVVHDWNVGQAQMDFDLDTGHCVEPPSTRLRKVNLTGFEGDNGSASHA